MPPLPQWFVGADAIAASIGSMVFAPAGPGAFRLVPTKANGPPALAAYRLNPNGETFEAMALHLLGLRDGEITAFVGAPFGTFGLAAKLPAV
jgi:RNA polymerase sigma-70 factor (ECF subfamily)